MSIADKLVYLDGTKAKLREAINIALAARGEAPIDSNDTFRSYAERLFYPGFLFGQGEQGTYSLPPNASTYFTDTSGTTPAALTDAVALVLDESGNGNDWTQATAGSRPVWAREPEGGRRNLLTYSEDFTNVAHLKSRLSVTPNTWSFGDTPGSTFTATETNANGFTIGRGSVPTGAGTYTSAWVVRKGTSDWALITMLDGPSVGVVRSWYNLSAGSLGTTNVAGTGASFVDRGMVSLGGGNYLIWMRATVPGDPRTILAPSVATNGSFGCTAGDVGYAARVQLETAATPTPYQRVTTAADVTETGVPSIPYLRFDLSDDALTATLPAGTYTVALPTRQGIWFDSVSHAGGAFDVGPTTYTGGPAGILTALESDGVAKLVAMPLVIDRALTPEEQSALVGWYQSKGAGEILEALP